MSDIVIDADIMQSAGTSEHPHSSNARKVLDFIWSAGHNMVQCAPLKKEYDDHEGSYAATWRARMISKKRWKHWKYQEDSELRDTLVKALPDAISSKEWDVIKDAHLLEAAAATDLRIVSKDAKALNLFRHSCSVLGIHKSILWGDVTNTPDDVIQWIKDGCVDRNDFKLCPIVMKKAEKKFKK